MPFPLTTPIPKNRACLWSYQTSAEAYDLKITPPCVCLDGQPIDLVWDSVSEISRTPLPQGGGEIIWAGPIVDHADLSLELRVRMAPESPIIRYRYILHSSTEKRWSNDEKATSTLTYGALDLKDFHAFREIRFGSFSEKLHSFVLEECQLEAGDFANRMTPGGPLLAASDGRRSLLWAYEHGSEVPGNCLGFRLAPERSATLTAVKGNAWEGRPLGPDAPYETLWFQLGIVDGDFAVLAETFREFMLRWQSANQATRKPQIFYNTWNHQERIKACGRAYLDDMHQARMLKEIDIAHRMGIDVFVIDTGWYSKTGDWQVDLKRFPDGLKTVKKALDARGMQLGLWFNPTVAAVSSTMRREHEDCVQEWRGTPHAPHPIWETEESQGLCVVSHYGDAFADELIRLHREVGVTYFKWDAVGQEGPWSCDAANHGHGGLYNSPEERAACYTYEQPRALTQIIEKLCATCPDAIVDFDVTEGGRCMGLAFPSEGKFFLVNNGPYYHNYDLPPPANGNVNLFFNPGPARAWIGRSTLEYDRWIPSVLFLVHYLPDGPRDSQWINAASLMLGHNGIWGDLASLDETDIQCWRQLLDAYKIVRDDVARAYPIRSGQVGASPEIHEKIAPNGRGLVAIFASKPGVYDYVTRTTGLPPGHPGMAGVEILSTDPEGRAHIRATFDSPSARLLFFHT